MNELWHNDETASRYGENSRRRFEEMFTADHMIDAYINLYTSLLHEKPRLLRRNRRARHC
ncbi:hypothetical protein IE993_11470 [Klebsiella pneumoniae]|nr:hypothetical protein [Klebsiella pneumoniae]